MSFVISATVNTKSYDFTLDDSIYNALTNDFIPKLNLRIRGDRTDDQMEGITQYTLVSLLTESLVEVANKENLSDADIIKCGNDALLSWAGVSAPPSIVAEQPLEGDALKLALKSYAADKRYQIEIGGTIVDGIHYATDRSTQNAIARAFLCLANGALIEPIDWKGSGTWVQLSQADLLNVARIVSMHVQGAFTKERLICEGIDNGTIVNKEAIDSYAW